jgi:hypothetical protein
MKVITRDSPLPTETRELRRGLWTSLDCNLRQTAREGLAEALRSIFVETLKYQGGLKLGKRRSLRDRVAMLRLHLVLRSGDDGLRRRS